MRLFRIGAIGAVCLIGGLAAEIGLRWRREYIARSDILDPGMVQYDSRLGWKLTPGWTGRHRHHDFAATYAINIRGFRADTPFPASNKSDQLSIFVGDSFTFGLGVSDTETFVHLLHASPAQTRTFANAAVPGYSTDQEALLIERQILDLRPDEIVLVVYAANDLFDNARAVPLQVGSPKPYFQATDQGLQLRNIPVPLKQATRRPEERGLVSAVLGSDSSQWTLKARLEQSSELFRVLSESILPEKDYQHEFSVRFRPAVQLFGLIMDRMAKNCGRRQVKLTVVLMAGRSFFEAPGSVSAQYQNYFLQETEKHCRTQNLKVLDLAGLMRRRYVQGGGSWFFPHEGHLNATGHKVVAEILAPELGRLHDRESRP